MEFNPKVSIIIPVYNGSNYLRQAIDSAIAQTYKNIEILVINDGSTDNGKTEEIAKLYGSKIRYLYKENGGVSSALNLGIKEMTGEYFSWLSHDDVYMPHKIMRQVAFLNETTNAHIVMCNFEVIDGDGTLLYEYTNNSREIISTGRDVMEIWINFCGLLVHRACFEKSGIFNIHNKTTQDLEMLLRLVRHYCIYSQSEMLFKCRKHTENISLTAVKLHTDDKFYLFNFILDNFDVSFFFSRNMKTNNPTLMKAEAYNYLANDALFRGTVKGARLCYRQSLISYPSFSNIASLKLITTAGPVIFLGKLYHESRRLVVSLMKQLTPKLFSSLKFIKHQIKNKYHKF